MIVPAYVLVQVSFSPHSRQHTPQGWNQWCYSLIPLTDPPVTFTVRVIQPSSAEPSLRAQPWRVCVCAGDREDGVPRRAGVKGVERIHSVILDGVLIPLFTIPEISTASHRQVVLAPSLHSWSKTHKARWKCFPLVMTHIPLTDRTRRVDEMIRNGECGDGGRDTQKQRQGQWPGGQQSSPIAV